MKTSIFAIRDNIGDYFTPPFFCLNHRDAMRAVSHTVNHPSDAPIHHAPDDFVLYHLGSYDDQNASFDILPLPEVVISCGSLKRLIEKVEQVEEVIKND